MQTRDDGLVLSAKIAGLQKKWDNICQRLHRGQPLKEAPMFPAIVGFQVTKDKREDAAINNCSSSARVLSHKNSFADLNSRNFMDLPKISLSRSNTFPLSGKASNGNFVSKLQEETSKTEVLELGGHKSPFSLSISSVDEENRTSSPSGGSVTTDLGLGLLSLPTSTCKLKKPPNHNSEDFPSDLSGCCSTNVDLVHGKVGNGFTPSSSCSSLEHRGQMNSMDVKTLFRLLEERVFWQDQALSIISQTISQRQTRSDKHHRSNLRGDIWFNFAGPDKYGKRKVAIALAEILYGNKHQLIRVDLSSQDGMTNPDSLLESPCMKSYSTEFRGKTVLDFVAAELSKQPLTIVMLENVDKAELLDQNRLSLAIQTGKLSDLHGREVSIKNAIFVTTSTSSFTKEPIIFPDKLMCKYSEERLLKARSWPLQIKVDSRFGDQANGSKAVSDAERKSTPSPFFMSKRKLNLIDESSDQHEISEMVKRSNKTSNKYLDLNRPAEENAQHDIDAGDYPDNETTSEISKTWLQGFCNHIDQVVVFKPFDFDAVAQKILKDIKKIFHSVFGSDYMLEIDSKVMEQLLAAAYISYGNREVDDWMEQVLSRKFLEIKRIHILSTRSIVKLSTTCDQELTLEEKTAEICLPQRIILDPKPCSS